MLAKSSLPYLINDTVVCKESLYSDLNLVIRLQTPFAVFQVAKWSCRECKISRYSRTYYLGYIFFIFRYVSGRHEDLWVSA